MKTVTITIGRNVPQVWGGQIAMDAEGWAGFRNDVQTLLENTHAVIYVAGALGRGEWQGVEEENATYVASVEPERLSELRDTLSLFADRWHQDAIALTVGDTDLVEP